MLARVLVAGAMLALADDWVRWADGALANPEPFETEVGLVRLEGDEWQHRLVQVSTGYTLVEAPPEMRGQARYAYAASELRDDGNLVASPFAAIDGLDPDAVAELVPDVKPRRGGKGKHRRLGDNNTPVDDATHASANSGRRLGVDLNHMLRLPLASNGDTPTVLQNFVLRVRFANHASRTLPSDAAFAKLLNGNATTLGSCDGNDEDCSTPTQSVREFYYAQSYQKLIINSTMTAWIDLPKDEAYYTGGCSGLCVDAVMFLEGIIDVLGALDASGEIDFSQFDTLGGGVNGLSPDGLVDMFTIIHSGYAAEFGGAADADGAAIADRMWSHQWFLNDVGAEDMPAFFSTSNIGFNSYTAIPALWDIKGAQISHVGIYVHEMGHYFGLPDFYSDDTRGLGAWGVMSSQWGFDNTQYYPPSFCAWSRIDVGFAEVTEVSESSVLTLNENHLSTGQIYRFAKGYPAGEYLLVEYRSNIANDVPQPGSGVLIWKVDEAKNRFGRNNEEASYPGSIGWPLQHHHVALLEADGKYELQRLPRHDGDAADLWTVGGEISDLTLPTLNSYRFIACRKRTTGLTRNKLVISHYDAASDAFTLVYTSEGEPCGCLTKCFEAPAGIVSFAPTMAPTTNETSSPSRPFPTATPTLSPTRAPVSATTPGMWAGGGALAFASLVLFLGALEHRRWSKNYRSHLEQKHSELVSADKNGGGHGPASPATAIEAAYGWQTHEPLQQQHKTRLQSIRSFASGVSWGSGLGKWGSAMNLNDHHSQLDSPELNRYMSSNPSFGFGNKSKSSKQEVPSSFPSSSGFKSRAASKGPKGPRMPLMTFSSMSSATTMNSPASIDGLI